MNLQDMRVAVWDYLVAYYPEATNPDGTVSPDFRIDPLYPKMTVDRLLNQSLTAHFVDLSIGAPEAFSDQENIDVVAGQVEYKLPADMAFLRSLWWKDPGTAYAFYPAQDRKLMPYYDQDDKALEMSLGTTVPTFRRQMEYIVLNDTPTQDNPEGIQVRYIKWVNYLADDDVVIESEFARILQEVITLDAAVAASSRKGMMDTTELRKDLATWEARLSAAAGLSNSPPFKQLTFFHPMTIGAY